MTERTPAEVVQYAADEGVQIVDLRFCDLPGLMQHFSVPIGQLTEDTFEDGFGFDGSSIRGFQEIQESDMILRPDPDTAVIDLDYLEQGLRGSADRAQFAVACERLLTHLHGRDAYSQYNAHLRRLVKLERALESRISREYHSRRRASASTLG